MRSLLYLVHRLPYPPNKGDKSHSFHLLRYLGTRHRVFLGAFVDDPADICHLDTVRALCAELHVERLYPRLARLRSLSGLVSGEALTLPYYRNANMQSWVDRTIAAERIDTAVVLSTPMVQYVGCRKDIRRLVDFVDVDSAKWSQYASSHAWPLSWLYRRESRRLLAYESASARQAQASFFVTDAEVAHFRSVAPDGGDRVETVGQGVDAEFFTPERDLASPFAPGEIPLVFTGTMDYWPNVDAVSWFAADVLPEIRRRWATARFYIVGMRPTPAVMALDGVSVVVTGTVPDVRPYLRHAAVVVAPLRLARGIQSKVLEAMSMGKAVVVSQVCALAIDAQIGSELESATDAADFIERIDSLLRQPQRAGAIGAAARARVVSRYSWPAQFTPLDRYLVPIAQSAPALS